MVAVRISPFGGMVPAVDDRLLPVANAALSQDAWLFGGTCVGLPQFKVVRTLTNPLAGKVYRIPNNYTDNLHFADSTWIEFPSTDTDVIRSQVVGDTYDRYYWVSPLDVPRYATLAMITAGSPTVAAAWKLGIPAPGAISGTVTSGASATLKSVVYVSTWVSAYGEEGPPSPPKSYTGEKIDATYTITFATPDPADLGTNRNLTKTRLYRTVTSNTGVATYFLVAEVPIANTTYADDCSVATDAVIALNSGLYSTTWSEPPSDLQGISAISNGMVAGFRNNEIWFCEPFRMHAWPINYVLTTEYPIVGLGVANQTLVVATKGFTYTASGINPGSISLTKLPGLLPCTSRGSIASAIEGVYFSTPAGLALVSPRGVAYATENLILKDSWLTLTPTNTIRAAMLGPLYYGFGQSRYGVFDSDGFNAAAFAQSDFGDAFRGVLIDPKSKDIGFNLLSSPYPTVNVQTDAWSSEVFVIRNGQVLWIDIGDLLYPRGAYIWRSKIYQPSHLDNLQAMKVYFNTKQTWPTTYVPDELVPIMSGATTSGVTMASDTYIVDRDAWRASDGNPTTDAWLSAGDSLPHYLSVTFEVAKTVATYTIGGPPPVLDIGTAPKTWTLQGSNNGAIWVVLDTRTNQSAFITSEIRTYSVTSQGSYKYYKLEITAVQSGTQVSISSFQLLQAVLGRVLVYADGRRVMQRNLVKSGEQWRMPSGFKADFWQFEIQGGVEIYSLQAATSSTELRSL